MSPSGPPRAHRVEVSEEIDALANHDYASAFAVTASSMDDRSAEQWVRAAFEGAPTAVRWLVLVGWRYVLRLRLAPRPSPGHVLGWRILSETPDSIVLEVQSALMTARKVLRVEGSRIVMTTVVRYDRRTARALWSAAAPVHHLTEPYLLGHAASHPSMG